MTFTRLHCIGLLLVTLISLAPVHAEAAEKKTVQSASPEILVVERVYYLQVRVIFAGTTGFYGNVVRELADMKDILTKNFKYPSYELSNTIRLSFFGGEEATALVFPDHYLRVIPKGSSKGNRLKLKMELYHAPQGSDVRTRIQAGNMQFQEKREGSHSVLFPIAGSATILTPKQWDAFGGVPVYVNFQGRVSSNTMSSSPITQPGLNNSLGIQKYLILGIQLNEVKI